MNRKEWEAKVEFKFKNRQRARRGKLHTRKKEVRAAWKSSAKAGLMPDADGSWHNRGGMKENSMRRDFSPQEG